MEQDLTRIEREYLDEEYIRGREDYEDYLAEIQEERALRRWEEDHGR